MEIKAVNKTPLFKLLREARKLEAQGFIFKAEIIRNEVKARLRHIKDSTDGCRV